MTAISMPPAIVMAVPSSIESRAINITVHHTPHDWTAVPIDHRTIDIAVDDAVNDGLVINIANDHGTAIAIVIAIPATIAVAAAPPGFSRCSSQSAEHKGGRHREEFQLAKHEQPR